MQSCITAAGVLYFRMKSDLTYPGGVPVYFGTAADYDPAELGPALEQVLDPVLTAAGGVRGRRVMVKPNLLEYKFDGDPAAVHPALLLELCRHLDRRGAARIAVIENPGTATAPAVVRRMGIAAELKELGVEVANCADYQTLEMPETSGFRRLELAAEYRDYDLVIDFAKAKTHAMMTLTLAVKNLFGLVRGSERLGWHLAVGRDFDRFADLLLDIWLAVRPRINLVDAIVCMEGNGPGSGTPVRRGVLAASSDALALDRALTEWFQAGDTPILRRAARRGLLPEIAVHGVPAPCPPLALPPPPDPELAWGVWLPPRWRDGLRRKLLSRPVADAGRCIGCGRCARLCPPQSLVMKNGRPVFDLPHCIRCYCCQEHCPVGAISVCRAPAMRLVSGLERLLRGSGIAALLRRKPRLRP